MKKTAHVSELGTLYVVATPIGNLGDITARAVDVLSEVNAIAVEDSRHSRKLLTHLGIATPLIALHDHNEAQRTPALIKRLQSGESVALISDAGTPLISDPGYHFVHAARAQGIPVVPLPGPCALVAALSVSGLPNHRFAFEGFLPAKSSARLAQLTALANEPRTLIFYESPHRLIAMLNDLVSVWGASHQAVLAKELTKQFESIVDGSLKELLDWLEQDPARQKGEFVILLAGTHASDHTDEDAERILKILLAELSLKQAVKLAAEITGQKKNSLYELALRFQ